MTPRSIFLISSLCLAAVAAAAEAQAPAPSSVQVVDANPCTRMKARGVLGPHAPVGCEKLAIVRFHYIDFEGRHHADGEIMVMAAAADFVQRIFDMLYLRRFPIARAKLMDHYAGDDSASMKENNTSAFNHRPISGGSLPSLHAYGLAIDLNPVQNPYIHFQPDGRALFSPASGIAYANRLRLRPGKPARSGMAEEVVGIFADNGFLAWGGYWDAPVDYQHFQVERQMAQRMAKLPAAQAKTLFAAYVQRYRACLNSKSNESEASARSKCIESQTP